MTTMTGGGGTAGGMAARWSGEAAEGPAQQFLVHAGAAGACQGGAGVGGQLGPGAEVAVCGVLVGERNVVGVSVGPDRMEQGDGLQDLTGREAGEVLPDEDAGGQH